MVLKHSNFEEKNTTTPCTYICARKCIMLWWHKRLNLVASFNFLLYPFFIPVTPLKTEIFLIPRAI